MAQSLRVLNAVRDYHIGIPLTYAQYVVIRIMKLWHVNSFYTGSNVLHPMQSSTY